MIANHHTLNIAFDGRHFARVKFPDLEPLAEVRRKVDIIVNALLSYDSVEFPENWSFTLTRVECSGYNEEIFPA
jgi:hypothetical protein